MTSILRGHFFLNIIIIYLIIHFENQLNFDNTIILYSLIDSNLKSKEKSAILTMNAKLIYFGGKNLRIEKVT